MKYDKPIVVELSNGARARGGPLSCLPGGVVEPFYHCGPGSADASCYAGTNGAQFADDCQAGSDPGHSCVSGTGAGWECGGGAAAELPRPCTVGSLAQIVW